MLHTNLYVPGAGAVNVTDCVVRPAVARGTFAPGSPEKMALCGGPAPGFAVFSRMMRTWPACTIRVDGWNRRSTPDVITISWTPSTTDAVAVPACGRLL